MLPKTEREALAQAILARSSADETEVLIIEEDLALSRFTHENIHQNIASTTLTIRLRVIHQQRCGVASTSASDPASLDALIARAMAIAQLVPPDLNWPGLPHEGIVAPAASTAFAEATAAATAEQRAESIDDIFTISEQTRLWAAGYLSTAVQTVTIANSHGRLCSYEGTEAILNIKQNGLDASGYAEMSSPDIEEIKTTQIANTAAQKAYSNAAPQSVEPGEWTVVLEPAAFGELLSYLSGHFSAQALEEGQSFLQWDDLGRRVTDATLTLRDDWSNPLAPGLPFDYEGTPRQILPLIEQGIARHIVTDSRWAMRLGRPNTGHSLPAPNSSGPQPLYLTVDPGTATMNEIIANVERGLLITRFWYIRPVDTRQTIVTGMTRDGTFLIENGKVTKGVCNMRFNQSIVQALAHVTLADQPVRTSGYNYTTVVPGARLERFNFSSTTSF